MDKQNPANQLKKNRVSFKQFQQHYEQQTVISKEKRKSQHQGLQKLAANNIRPLQNNNKQQVTIIDLTKHNKSSTVSQSKKSTQSLSLTELNSLNSSIAFPSNFVSPKSSTNALIKSINLASNKSKQLQHNLQSSSKQKIIHAKLNIIPKHNTMINLNCANQKNFVNRNPSFKKDNVEIQKNMRKISSISKMTTTDVGEISLLSFPSQKILQFASNDTIQENPSKSLEKTLQYVNYLTEEINFLNKVFKQLQNQHNTEDDKQKQSQLSYKSKLLGQIRTKLEKQSAAFRVNMKQEQGPIKILHETVMTLLKNYEHDIRQSFVKTQNTQDNKCSKRPLSIKIQDSAQTRFDLQVNQRRLESKKKTIKLSKSRKTHEQTMNSQSKVRQYFQTSQFSILNTSKITQVSRLSSQNKNLAYMNEIEHVIHSKILDNYEDEGKENEQQRPKYDMGNRMKMNLRECSKSNGTASINHFERNLSSQIQKDIIKEIDKTTNVIKGQSSEDGKKKAVSKTISLISKNTSVDKKNKELGNKQYPSVPKCTKIPMKENINCRNFPIQKPQTQVKVKSISLGQGKSLAINLQHQESPVPSQSHNQSIYELQFLENYSGLNVPLNYGSMQQKYSQNLFR